MGTVNPFYYGANPYTLYNITQDQIRPFFGYARPKEKLIFINEELPKRVYNSVLAHEEYHLCDKVFDGYWNREWRAWKAQWRVNKWNTILTFGYSFIKLYRWKLYIKLARKQIVPVPLTVERYINEKI